MLIANSSHTRNVMLNSLGDNAITIENDKIEFVSEFKYLGVMLDSHLNFNEHVSYITKKIYWNFFSLLE